MWRLNGQRNGVRRAVLYLSAATIVAGVRIGFVLPPRSLRHEVKPAGPIIGSVALIAAGQPESSVRNLVCRSRRVCQGWKVRLARCEQVRINARSALP